MSAGILISGCGCCGTEWVESNCCSGWVPATVHVYFAGVNVNTELGCNLVDASFDFVVPYWSDASGCSGGGGSVWYGIYTTDVLCTAGLWAFRIIGYLTYEINAGKVPSVTVRFFYQRQYDGGTWSNDEEIGAQVFHDPDPSCNAEDGWLLDESACAPLGATMWITL